MPIVRTIRWHDVHICFISADVDLTLESAQIVGQMPCRRTRVLFMKSETLGRLSEETLGRSVACMDNLNLTETLTLTKWTDVRAASENTSFLGHVTWNAVKTPPGESTYI
jgi:hypothetical protein